MSDEDRDPVVHSSLSKPLFLWSALLVLSLIWGLWDEVYGIRPWKSYQAKFSEGLLEYLASAKTGAVEVEKQIRESPEYKRLDAEMQAAEKAAMPAASAIDREVNEDLVPKILALNEPFQEVRGHIGALTYQIEVSHSESSKDSLRKQIEGLKAEMHKISLPGLPNQSMNFADMGNKLAEWKAKKAELLQKRVEVMKAATELRASRDKYLSDRISDASAADDCGGGAVAPEFRYEDPADSREGSRPGWDRCESCHLATREPVVLTAANMGGEKAFTTHPNKELLKLHDPEKFGCTPCHGGNGANLTSVTKAHGYNKFWLWPMHARENMEAGCQQCHGQGDRHREFEYIECGPRNLPAARLHGLPSL